MLPAARSGTLRGLAVTSTMRVPVAPDIPTVGESGVPGFDVSAWNALFVPAKIPADIVRKVNEDAVAARVHPSVRQRLEEIGAVVAASTPAALATHLKSEMKKWGPVIKEAGIRPQ